MPAAEALAASTSESGASSSLVPAWISSGGSPECAARNGETKWSAQAAGVDVTYTRWPHMWHDFALQPGLLAAADSALAQAAWFVSKVTASS